MRQSRGLKCSRWRWILVLLLLATVSGIVALRNLGNWLALNERLEKSQAIVVLGGQVPFRAMEAARLFHEGWAPEVWLTQGEIHPEDKVLAQIGVEDRREHLVSQLVLLKLGVPTSAIRVLPEPVANTLAEVRVASSHEATDGKLIVVTSKAHARRVRITWNAAAANRGAVVRYASGDPFEPLHWWSTTTDVLSVAREILGIVNAWIGFPLSPRTASSAHT